MSLQQEELQGTEVSPTWKMAVRVWWAITWRGFLLSMVPVFLLTIPVSIVFLVLEHTAGVHPSITSGMSQGVGMLIGFCVQVYVIKKILNKEFPDFKVTVTTKTGDDTAAVDHHTSVA
jgi:hypothetical protein